uniref:Uncharacterized protein n=1 Tax=Calidris pygmaea TaxID=425635 RepID=A0A8C3PKJ3_9CHAR
MKVSKDGKISICTFKKPALHNEKKDNLLKVSHVAKNLDCPELTEAFLNSQKAGKEKTDGARRKSLSDNESDDSKSKKKCDSVDKPRGFARGLDPEQIIGAMDNSGKLMFLMESTWSSGRCPCLWRGGLDLNDLQGPFQPK